MIANDEDILELYVNECSQAAQALENLLLEVEKTGVLDQQSVSEFFRLVHTLKGSSAMMGFVGMEKTSHLLEDVLSNLRKHGSPCVIDKNRELLEVSLDYVQYFSRQLELVGSGADEESPQTLVARLEALTQGETTEIQKAISKPANEIPLQTPEGKLCIRVRLKRCPLPHVRASIVARALKPLCISVLTDPAMLSDHPELADDILQNGFALFITAKDGVDEDQVFKKLAAQPYFACYEKIWKQSTPDVGYKKDSFAQVSQQKLNELLNKMDELLSAEAALTASLNAQDRLSIQSKLFLTQMHSGLLDAQILSSEMGMVKIGVVFSQMRRLVRGIAQESGKRITVTMLGSDILIDRSVVEILSEVLIHIVRNAVDHGIELPEERKLGGKQEMGIITMEAIKKNEQIHVRIQDDGAGIDKSAVMQKAVSLGILDKEQENLSDREIYSILLKPGFSTSKSVTRYSGRGVGLDTVTKRIHNIGGSFSIESQYGTGTTFLLHIPTTIIVMDGLEVQLNAGRIVIPVNAIAYVEDLHAAKEDKNRLDARFDGYQELRLCDPSLNDVGEEYGTKCIFFREEYGRYFIWAQRIGRLREALTKPLPQYILDALGAQCILSGCVLSGNAENILCILDVQRLIDREETMGKGTI